MNNSLPSLLSWATGPRLLSLSAISPYRDYFSEGPVHRGLIPFIPEIGVGAMLKENLYSIDMVAASRHHQGGRSIIGGHRIDRHTPIQQ